MRLFLLLVSAMAAARCGAEVLATFHTDASAFDIDARGSLSAIRPGDRDRNLIAPGQPAPVLQLRVGGVWRLPDGARWDASGRRLTLHFGGSAVEAVVGIVAKPTHLALELVRVEGATDLEIALWGPYPTTLGETIGEIVGVVRDRSDAVGIQALNPKTLGGSPQNENDVEAEFGADDTGYYPGMPDELRRAQGFRGDTARPAPFGSLLQAYCRRRDADRTIPNWGHEKFQAPAFADGGVVGSRIALFACPQASALAAIGSIEVSEGLPHPLLDGRWAKTAAGASASYLIVDFGEDTVDRAIEMTRRAGLRRLYQSSPFETWGHFKLKPALFPRGWQGFRECVAKARRAGVELGVHTLSNFITPSDEYVTPVPDPRLTQIGAAELAADVGAASREVEVADPELFKPKSALNTVRIGDELIRFASVSETAPWRLKECERGAWGTRASAHSKGARVGRLLDHDYRVFFGDASLSQEIARRIAEFCNRTGVSQLSFDGLEGNWSTGMGQYGRTLFTKAWYDALDPGAQGGVINDASNPGHFNWHVNTRMNWGEPWYAGFRESQTLYRFRNQLLFERNLMPHMLGWFALRPETGVEDAEWLLARAAGFDAGFALATSLASTAQLSADPGSADTARRFGATTAILEAVSQWETARMAGAFPAELKARLRDNRREYTLRAVRPGEWDLREAFVSRFEVPSKGTGPEDPLERRNSGPAEPLHWIVRSTAKVPVGGVRVSVRGREAAVLKSETIPAGGSLKFGGGPEAVLYDNAWKEVARVPVDPTSALATSGAVRVEAGAGLPEGASLNVEVRSLGPAVRIRSPAKP